MPRHRFSIGDRVAVVADDECEMNIGYQGVGKHFYYVVEFRLSPKVESLRPDHFIKVTHAKVQSWR